MSTLALPSRLRLDAQAAPYLVMAAVLVAMVALQTTLLDPSNFLTFFLKPVMPAALLAVGQVFVVTAGDFDLSVGSQVTLSAILASEVVGGEDGRWLLGLAVIMGVSLVVGLINAAVTLLLKVPSLLGTLGMLLVLDGTARLVTDGVPSNILPEAFRQWGRGGFAVDPLLRQLPWSVVIAVPVMILAGVLLHRTTFGNQITIVGGNPRAARVSGIPSAAVRFRAFLLSSTLAGIAAFLLSGFTGVSLDLGTGLEFQAIAAVVLGGAVLGGGKGSVPAAVAGAVTLAALFTVLNLLGLPQPLRLTVQGLILIGAVAIAARSTRKGN
ncbi:ABC transporter permease [Euzebya tangerina]|uniref:ABC transporter permease n=1 Tax=Euzebya tangerina TaxID=591198 RepID=UPI000E312F01|nr:ABC transporter permease [Euzebya tangerina]